MIDDSKPSGPSKTRHDCASKVGQSSGLATILFLAANPAQLPLLRLDEECRVIERSIQAAKFRDRISFRTRWAARFDDLLQALNETTPLVLHISGHGTGTDGICLESDSGEAVYVNGGNLARLITSAGDSIRAVFLNSCYSQVQAEVIAKQVPCVVGTSGAIGDEAATVYAGSFYRALAFGKSVGNAHMQGNAALEMHLTPGNACRDVQLRDGSTPAAGVSMLTRADVDADLVYLIDDICVPRKNCRISIKATLKDFEEDKALLFRVLEELRRVTGDMSLEITDLTEGSVRLSLNLSSRAAEILQRSWRDGKLSTLGGFQVSEVVDISDLKAAVKPASPTNIARPRTGRARPEASAYTDIRVPVAIYPKSGAVYHPPSGVLTLGAAKSWGPVAGSPHSSESVVVPGRNSIATVVAGHEPMLQRLALRLAGDPHLARDLVQETILRGLRKFESLAPGSNPAAWLTTTLTNLFHDHLKHQKVEVGVVPELVALEDVSYSAIPTFGDAELHDAIRALEPELREIMELAYLNQMSYREIAARLGIPTGTIATRLSRARAHLRALLQQSR